MVILLAAVCGILWGSAFPSVKTGYELFQIAPEDNASKLLFAGIRFGMAGLVTIPVRQPEKKAGLPARPAQYCRYPGAGTGADYSAICFLLFRPGQHTGVKASIFGAVSTLFRGSAGPLYLPDDRLNRFKGGRMHRRVRRQWSW